MANESTPYTWIGLSGSIPEIEELRKARWSELGTRLVISRLASRILGAGSGIVYGSHPTFVPLIEAAAAAIPQLDVTTKMIRMFVARRFLQTDADEHDFIQAHRLYADIVCTGERDQARNPALTDMREQMANACDALICVGGKLHRDGAPPGVDEEAELILQRGKPVYLIGAGGGRALQVFREKFREHSDTLNNGLTHEENRLLAETTDPWQATTIVVKGLRDRELLRRVEHRMMLSPTNIQTSVAPELVRSTVRADRVLQPPSGEESMDTLEHLKMVQGVVSRLAGNSFSIKGWSLTLAAAIIAFAAGKDASLFTMWFALAAAVPVLFFWGLDAYYLNLERQFRRLYEAILQEMQQPEAERKIEPFSMNLAHIAGEVETVWRTAWRRATWGFHLPLLLAVFLSCGALWWLHGGKTTTGGKPSGEKSVMSDQKPARAEAQRHPVQPEGPRDRQPGETVGPPAPVLPPAAPAAVPAPLLREAPVSITLKGMNDGHEVLVTLRGADFASVKAQAQDPSQWLQLPRPTPPPATVDQTALVVRLGAITPQYLQKSVTSYSQVPGVTGFSVQSAPNKTINELAAAGRLSSDTISVTTIGKLQAAAQAVGTELNLVTAPGRGFHHIVVTPMPLPTELAEALSKTFQHVPNPVPQRGGRRSG